jgi:hypothetical protein
VGEDAGAKTLMVEDYKWPASDLLGLQ